MVMKFFPLITATSSLTILSLVTLFSPAECSAKVIYRETMTPTWLEAHAFYMDSSRTKTTEQLTFNAGSVDFAALLKVNMIAAGVLPNSAPLTVKIVVSHDVSIGSTHDSDISYGVSDGTSFVGFHMDDKSNYDSYAPCYGYEGTIAGTTLTKARVISSSSPRPSDSFYPGRFVLTLKLDEQWGACYTAHDGGFVKTAGFNKQLMLRKGLTLEAYKQHKDEKVGIKFIEVTIIQNA